MLVAEWTSKNPSKIATPKKKMKEKKTTNKNQELSTFFGFQECKIENQTFSHNYSHHTIDNKINSFAERSVIHTVCKQNETLLTFGLLQQLP